MIFRWCVWICTMQNSIQIASETESRRCSTILLSTFLRFGWRLLEDGTAYPPRFRRLSSNQKVSWSQALNMDQLSHDGTSSSSLRSRFLYPKIKNVYLKHTKRGDVRDERCAHPTTIRHSQPTRPNKPPPPNRRPHQPHRKTPSCSCGVTSYAHERDMEVRNKAAWR